MSTVSRSRPGVTHSGKRPVRVSSVRVRDQALSAASTAYRLAQELSEMVDARMAEVFVEHRTTFNRKKQGQLPSAKSRTRDQIIRLGEAGGNPWPLCSDDLAAAVQSAVAPRTVAELLAAMDEADMREESANARVNQVQFRRMKNLPYSVEESRAAKLEQVAWTLVLLAIKDELALRGASIGGSL